MNKQNNRPKITILDGIPLNPGDISWQPLEEVGDLTIYDHHDASKIKERIDGADIVLTNKAPIGANLLPLPSSLKLIGVLATGVNVVDLSAMQKAGIAVCNVPAYGPEDVAQHALALLMELARNITIHSESVKKGEWNQNGWCYWKKAPLSLSGLTMGIVGFGAIGQIMGRYAHALGMNVLAYSPHTRATAEYPFRYAPLDELLAKSDVVSLHCPLTPENERLVNRETLGAMKKGAILLNTSRGALIDEEACANALISGQLGGLGTDVLNNEPPTEGSPLLAAPNTLITPHMAWATAKSRQNIVDIMADNIRSFLAGEPKNLVSARLP